MPTELTPDEQRVYPARQEAAFDRLTRAMQREAYTRHLPPGDVMRDAAVREWRWAQAVAEEWGVQ
ncbi:MAG TPA: hypothetical protein VF245_12900 [Solirubrobacterales bacterium]